MCRPSNFSCDIRIIRGPVHSLYPPVRILPQDRPAILDEYSAYHTEVLFEIFPETPLVVARFPWYARDAAATALFVLWPVFAAAREAFVQWAYLSVGWAILHAARPNDAGYGVPAANAMRAAAVGGALFQAIVLACVLFPVFVRAIYCMPLLQRPASERNADGTPRTRTRISMALLLRHHILRVLFIAPSEMASAAAAAALGTAVLRHAATSPTEFMDVAHVATAGVVGAAVLYVPQVVWYLLSLYFAWSRLRQDQMGTEVAMVTVVTVEPSAKEPMDPEAWAVGFRRAPATGKSARVTDVVGAQEV